MNSQPRLLSPAYFLTVDRNQLPDHARPPLPRVNMTPYYCGGADRAYTCGLCRGAIHRGAPMYRLPCGCTFHPKSSDCPVEPRLPAQLRLRPECPTCHVKLPNKK